MHFSLRTLLVVTTAVAIYVGASLGIVRTMNISRGWVGSGALNYAYLLSGLPTFVLWVVAIVWAFERRLRPGMTPLVWGLILTAAWRLVGPLIQSGVFQWVGPSGGGMQSFFIGFSLLNVLIQTVAWALLFYAVVKVAEPQPARPSPWEEPTPVDLRDR